MRFIKNKNNIEYIGGFNNGEINGKGKMTFNNVIYYTDDLLMENQKEKVYYKILIMNGVIMENLNMDILMEMENLFLLMVIFMKEII